MYSFDAAEARYPSDTSDRFPGRDELRRLFETMAQGVVYQDRSGQIVAANEAAQKILGLTFDQMLGRTSMDPRWRAIREDGSDLRGEEHPAMIALRTGREVDGSVMGVYNPVEDLTRWIHVHARPLFESGEDEPYGVYTTFEDITGLRETERKLREAEAKYRAIVENSPDVITRFGRDLRCRFASPSIERFCPVNAEEAIGRTHREVGMPDAIAERLETVIRGVFRDGCGRSVMVELETPDGTLHFDWRAFPELDQEGEVRTVMTIAQDETDRVELEARMREAQKMEAVGRLAGGIAHDFNNLLTVIRGHSSIAQSQLDRDHPIRDGIDEVVRSADRAADLTRQLLAFGRKQVLESRVVDLGDVVRDAERMLSRLVEESIDLELEVDDEVHPVCVDPTQIEQVVLNLVVNARDAIEDGGTITVRVRTCSRPGTDGPGEGGEWVCLEVEDDGAGMDAETLEKIFEPFFTTKDLDEGTGLGLSTVYGIVRQSEGVIDVDSEPGRGTVFTIGFPALEEDALDPESDPGGEERRDIVAGARILLVEDEGSVRRLARKVLEDRGCTVIEASDPATALEEIDAGIEHLDLLLTDVVMPGMSGSELARRVVERHPGTAVLFMSGYGDEMVRPGSHEGLGNLLQKPFSPRELVSAACEILDGVLARESGRP